MTLYVYDVPLSQAISDLAYGLDINIITHPAIKDRLVSLELDAVPFDLALHQAATLATAQVIIEQHQTTIIDRHTDADDWTLLPSGYYESTDVAIGLRAILSDDANVVAFADRVVVSGTKADVQAAKAYREHLLAGPSAWLLDVLVVEIQESVTREIGLAWSLSAKATSNINAGTGTLATSGNIFGAQAQLLADVVGRLVEDGRYARLSNRGTLYLLEGQSATMRQGDRIPVPRRQTSPEGTVQVVGFDAIQSGFSLEASGRGVPGGLLLKVEPRISEIAGFVLNEAPILLERSVQATAVLEDGQWLILSGLDRTADRTDRTGLPHARSLITQSKRTSDEQSSLLVLVRATRVFSATLSSNADSQLPLQTHGQ